MAPPNEVPFNTSTRRSGEKISAKSGSNFTPAKDAATAKDATLVEKKYAQLMSEMSDMISNMKKQIEQGQEERQNMQLQLIKTQQDMKELQEKVQKYEQATSQLTSQQPVSEEKVQAIVDIALEVAIKESKAVDRKAQAQLQRQIDATTTAIKDLRIDMEKAQEAQQASTTAAAVPDFAVNLAKLEETISQQGQTLEVLSQKHCSYDSTLAQVKKLHSQVEKVQREVSDTSTKTDMAAEKQELQRVLPSVVLEVPKGTKAEALKAALNQALNQGIGDKQHQHLTKDFSYTTKPFARRAGVESYKGALSSTPKAGGGSGSDGRSSSSDGGGGGSNNSSNKVKQTEKVLVTFLTAQAATLLIKKKRQLPAGMYAEPLLTHKEQSQKVEKWAAYKKLRNEGRHVTWWRARMMEYVKGDTERSGSWREVTVDTKQGKKASDGECKAKGVSH